jgi:murein DD-endopeptidase MepM/ murein hydrolase activator NlpD
MLGEYKIENENEEKILYGIKAVFPLAKGYQYTHYDDFGAKRDYGYKRRHQGHDILGSVGTPVLAVESGYVEALGWNQYGGWRIGIRSFDGQRYYYYAHLKKGHPYNDLYEGKYVSAGEVIGYLGMTGYSAKEDVNNINVPHLHIGMQIIFDKSQKDGINQIWIDMYELTKFLSGYSISVEKSADGKEYVSKKKIIDAEFPD